MNQIAASGHLGFDKYGGPTGAPASAPSKNEFRMFWSTSVPNFMLVDKSAQSSPLEPGLWSEIKHTFTAVCDKHAPVRTYKIKGKSLD